MTNTDIPRLCGGTVFTLILEARQQRYGVREHFAGDSDGLSEMDTLIGLAQVTVPDLKRQERTKFKETQLNLRYARLPAAKGIIRSATGRQRKHLTTG